MAAQNGQGDVDQLAAKVKAMQDQKGTNPSVQQAAQGQGLDRYIDSLLEEKGYPDITPEVKEELKKDLTTRLDDFIAARVIVALSDENVLIFEKMLKDGMENDKIQQFVAAHIPDYENFLTSVLLEFKEVFLGVRGVPTPASNSASAADDASLPPPLEPAPVKN